jgi:hypothetical protein
MDEREIGVSLKTPTKLEEFQEKLYVKAKAEQSRTLNAPREICPRAGCGKSARPVR